MDLVAIRQGLADDLSSIPGVALFPSIPDGLPVGANDALVIQPDPSVYVEYQPVNGLVNMNKVHMLVTIIVASTDWPTAQRRIDELLSCGTDQPRSIRTNLASHISAGGAACQVIPQSASVSRIDIAGVQHWAADFQLEIQARC